MTLSDYIPAGSDTWGPSKIHHSHTFVPVEFVGRTEKLGRFCDFTVAGMRARRGDHEGEEFKFVDSRAVVSRQKKYAPRVAQYQYGVTRGGRQFGGRQGATFVSRGGQWGSVRIDHRTGKPVPVKQGGKPGAVAFKPHWQRGGPSNIVKGIRDWSTPIKPEYNLMTELNLAQLGRHKTTAAKVDWFVSDGSKIEYESLLTCGELCMYEKSFDKVSPRQPKILAKADNVNFYNVSTGQDPVMEELITRAIAAAAETSSIMVACTDQVLSTLMTANRSIYSWDLIITRNGNTILIDKRDSSPLDFQSVWENASPNDLPQFDENIDPHLQINSPVKLGIEATAINQHLSQQVISADHCEEMEYPNPFEDEDQETPAAKGVYIYRKAFVPAAANGTGRDWNFIIRGEANAKLEDGKLVSIKGFNEFDSKTTCWRDHLEKGRETAVFATEMKNNSFKLARWLSSASVAGVEVMKVGFVSRTNMDDPWNHSLLSVQTHNVADLMNQTAMSTQTLWSSVCQILNVIVQDEQVVGRYLVAKDPAKPAIGLYQIPWEEFEEEDEDNLEDEEIEDEDE